MELEDPSYELLRNLTELMVEMKDVIDSVLALSLCECVQTLRKRAKP